MSVPPLGPQVDADGASFAVFSSVATAIDLCLFDDAGVEHRQPLQDDGEGLWWTRVDGLGSGAHYGLRVHGPWDPGSGRRCNPAKLLLDPYARAIGGGVTWHPSLDGADRGDSASYVPRSILHSGDFDWRDDLPPRRALEESIVYELHVKGFTKLHPGLAADLRGTYLGLADPEVIGHLQGLGITAVELLPVHQFVHDRMLVQRGLRNYWGYQSIGFFAPHGEYGSAGDGRAQVDEFKTMVRALHEAGLEVILDVVFNHTAEGDERGPTLCLRGLDNAAYYRLRQDPSRYVDDTGCGNTLDVHRPHGLRLVMDSLRYWVAEMHVDGFRFDLAASLGRGSADFDPFSPFLEAVAQDPVIGTVKLIAEPWDTGAGGYALGEFPPGWSEWNGRYRDTVRDFWRGRDSMLADFATRLTGSADLFGGGRRPSSSINLITVHDGFTLTDLVSYDHKHNEANGEDNRDGTDDNRSWNCGAEGPTDDAAILGLRRRQRSNLLATLLLSEGVPLLLAGDELGRSQAGNNNAYCQDNVSSWTDWSAVGGPDDLRGLVASLTAFRLSQPLLQRRRFFHDGEIVWSRPDGAEMSARDWSDPLARAIAVSARAGLFLLLVNAWWEPLTFTLAPALLEAPLTVLVDTSGARASSLHPVGAPIVCGGRSLALLVT